MIRFIKLKFFFFSKSLPKGGHKGAGKIVEKDEGNWGKEVDIVEEDVLPKPIQKPIPVIPPVASTVVASEIKKTSPEPVAESDSKNPTSDVPTQVEAAVPQEPPPAPETIDLKSYLQKVNEQKVNLPTRKPRQAREGDDDSKLKGLVVLNKGKAADLDSEIQQKKKEKEEQAKEKENQAKEKEKEGKKKEKGVKK
jgi:hypothetical protein